jgi:hypothetical protein
MVKVVSEDDRHLYSWVARDIGEFWNRHKPEKWRTFQLSSGSHQKSAARLTIILRQNAAWLDGSNKTSIDVLYDNFETKLLFALTYIKQQGEEQVNDILGSRYDITIGFWAFCRDLKNIHHLSCLALGQEPDAVLLNDRDRRKRKQEIINSFKQEIHSFLKEAVVISGSDEHSNDRLESALELARQALDQAKDDLNWTEG